MQRGQRRPVFEVPCRGKDSGDGRNGRRRSQGAVERRVAAHQLGGQHIRHSVQRKSEDSEEQYLYLGGRKHRCRERIQHDRI